MARRVLRRNSVEIPTKQSFTPFSEQISFKIALWRIGAPHNDGQCKKTKMPAFALAFLYFQYITVLESDGSPSKIAGACSCTPNFVLYYGEDIVVPEVAVEVGAPVVLVAAGAAFPTTITTKTSSPKNSPVAVDMRQLPRTVPAAFGAVIGTDRSNVAPDATELGNVNAVEPIALPPVFWNLKPASHAHDPEFRTCQVFVKVSPGSICVLSGIETSRTNVSA